MANEKASDSRPWAWGIAAAAFVAIFAVGFHCGYVDKIAEFFGYSETDGLTAGARFMRDVALALAAFLGIAMAAWRNREMSRQADAALKQSRASDQQARNESMRIAGERFSDAVKLLAHSVGDKAAIAVRVSAIYALQTLANNYASEYAARVVRTLVAYIKDNAQSTSVPSDDLELNVLGEDVKAAFKVLAQLFILDERELGDKRFGLSNNDLDFSHCDFSRLFLGDSQVSDLHRYKWEEADFRGSSLYCADFRKAQMRRAHLQGAFLAGANLAEACLYGADFRGAMMGSIKHDYGAGANLQGADLCFADLRGAKAQKANFRGADLRCARFADSDLHKAEMSGVKNLPLVLSDKIWHSGQPELDEFESLPRPIERGWDEREWDLKPYQKCPYALAGVLLNYAEFGGIFARGLRIAARKLLDDDKLPPGFPQWLREWLAKVDPQTGKHPDDRDS